MFQGKQYSEVTPEPARQSWASLQEESRLEKATFLTSEAPPGLGVAHTRVAPWEQSSPGKRRLCWNGLTHSKGATRLGKLVLASSKLRGKRSFRGMANFLQRPGVLQDRESNPSLLRTWLGGPGHQTSGDKKQGQTRLDRWTLWDEGRPTDRLDRKGLVLCEEKLKGKQKAPLSTL